MPPGCQSEQGGGARVNPDRHPWGLVTAYCGWMTSGQGAGVGACPGHALACRGVKPADVALLRTPGRPAIAPDGSILVAVAAPDVDADLNRGTIVRLRLPGGAGSAPDGGESAVEAVLTELTLGPRDSDPVISPDGRVMVFLRAGESGPAQLYSMPLDGAEPRKLTDHPLGAGAPVFAPDSSRIAYCAAVPEAGRYGTDDSVSADAEPPRRITRLAYRLDGEGFVADKPQQLFVLNLAPRTATVPTATVPTTTVPIKAGPTATGPTVPGSAEPVQLTDEPTGVADPAFTGDGRLVYVRSTGIDELTDEIAVIDIPDESVAQAGAAPTRGALLVPTRGSASSLTV